MIDDDLACRIDEVDWEAVGARFAERGHAVLPRLLTADECARTASLYDDDRQFRSRVVMERHAYGRGEYGYFNYPLPSLVETLRRSLYARLAPLANQAYAAMGLDDSFPPTLDGLLARCHAAGQVRPTPLLLRYRTGDENRLHQDLYGEHVFPLQVVVLLSEPGRAFTGGELVLTEQRPRAQSRVEVVPLDRGDAVVFAVRFRPVASRRGHVRVQIRHGVSRVRSGERYALGVVFHDAK